MTKYSAQNMQISFDYFRAWDCATCFNPLMSFCNSSIETHKLVMQSVDQSGWSVGQSCSQLASPPASQPASPPASQPASQSITQSVSQSIKLDLPVRNSSHQLISYKHSSLVHSVQHQ